MSPDSIEADLSAIAKCTQTPGAGASRPTFSDAWRRARDYVESELRACGCQIRIDTAGNLHARPAALDWDSPAWMSGSHIDSVPNGGDFDGVVGVVVPLALLRDAHTANRALPLELIIFAEEEGTTFGLGMLGSRTWTGELDVQRLAALRNGDGKDYISAGRPHGVNPAGLSNDRIKPEAIIGFVEVHIEQGPALWKNNTPVAVVHAIAGRRQYRCRLTGQPNHAGSTAMSDRRDALAGAAEIIHSLESLAGQLSTQTVITVGRLECHPNAVNVIPGRVEFTVDLRTDSEQVLAAAHERVSSLIESVARRRGLDHELHATEYQPVMPMDSRICSRLHEAARFTGAGPVPETVSGALHDAAILAPHVPTAMLFIASRDGISHNPAEFSRVQDILTAAQILDAAMQIGPLDPKR
jgi:hydantoinase/carbamoylase family amidase